MTLRLFVLFAPLLIDTETPEGGISSTKTVSLTGVLVFPALSLKFTQTIFKAPPSLEFLSSIVVSVLKSTHTPVPIPKTSPVILI